MYREKDKIKERDVAMFLMELSFGLERRKLRVLKWNENFYWNRDGSIKDKFKLEGKEICMSEGLIVAMKKLKLLTQREIMYFIVPEITEKNQYGKM